MNKLVVVASLMSAIGLSSVATAAPKDYVARMNEEGLYCARVQIQTVGLAYSTRTKCRTLAEWEEAGYVVSAPEGAEVQ